MDIFEWNENIPVTANNLNEMQNIINNNISEETLEVYSTSERKNGTWIDGKDLYERTIQIQNATKDTVVDYPHNIGNVDFIFIKNIMATNIDNNTTRMMNAFTSANAMAAQVNRTNITYRIPASDWGWSTRTFKLTVIVNYTKTTD